VSDWSAPTPLPARTAGARTNAVPAPPSALAWTAFGLALASVLTHLFVQFVGYGLGEGDLLEVYLIFVTPVLGVVSLVGLVLGIVALVRELRRRARTWVAAAAVALAVLPGFALVFWLLPVLTQSLR